MSSFIWPPSAAAPAVVAPVTFTWGVTGGGLKVGGGGIYSIPAIFIGNGGVQVGGLAPYNKSLALTIVGGGMVIGGLATVIPVLVFFTYPMVITGGGISVGGSAKISGRFIPDADFPEEDVGIWRDDPDYPGEMSGGT